MRQQLHCTHGAFFKARMVRIIAGYLVAFALLFFTFSPWTQGPTNFWLAASVSMGLMGAFAWFALGKERSKLLWFENRWLTVGIVSAVVLYIVSLAGVHILKAVSFQLELQVDVLYAYGAGTSRILIGTLLLFWLAPLEELFWRGFIQNRLMQRYGRTSGWLATVGLSLLAHIWTGNIALLLALLVAGLLWGWLFKRYQSLWPCIISHAIWDVLVFIVLPLQ